MLVRALILRDEFLLWMSFNIYREITRLHVSIWQTLYRRPRPKRERKWYLNKNSDYLMVIAKWYALWLGRTSKCTHYRNVVFVTAPRPFRKLESAGGPMATGAETNSVTSVKCTPPAMRKIPIREVMGFLQARRQFGYPRTVHTDARLGNSSHGVPVRGDRN